MDLPGLTVVSNSSSGIEIRVKLTQKYDCGEFRLNDNPQPIFISPWMQFEPSAMNNERLLMANEIVHRVVNYDFLLKEVEHKRLQLEQHRNSYDKIARTLMTTNEFWRRDRAKVGFPEDFSDITEWPPEMMGDY